MFTNDKHDLTKLIIRIIDKLFKVIKKEFLKEDNNEKDPLWCRENICRTGADYS